MSSTVFTPPEATTGTSTASTSAFVLSKFGPDIMPSLAMSVYMIAAKGSFAASAANSRMVRELSCVQPCVATFEPLASRPRTILPLNFCAISLNHSKSCTAFVPMITLLTPISSNCFMEASFRRPPPTSMFNIPSAAMADIVSVLTGRPSLAPSRSTICSHFAPSELNSCACSTGLSR